MRGATVLDVRWTWLAGAALVLALATVYATGQVPFRRLVGYIDRVYAVVVSPDGKTLYSGSTDCTIRYWDFQTGKTLAALDPPEAPYPADGETRGTYYDSVRGHRAPFINAMAITPDGKMLVVGAGDRSLRFWDVTAKKQVRKNVLPYARPGTKIGNAIRGVAVSPDGQAAASATEDKLVRLWSVKSGKEVRKFEGHTDFVLGVAFSPDGKLLASCGCDETVRLWEVATGKEVRILKGHTDYVRTVAFSPDGKLLASGGGDVNKPTNVSELKLWEVASGKEIALPRGHQDPVYSVVFSPRGTMLASGGGNSYARRGEVKLWDVSSRKGLLSLDGHTDVVKSVAFTPDGKSLVSGSNDKTIRVWDLREKD